MIVAAISVTVGLFFIVIVALDIMATVLHPEANSPLSDRFQRTVWRGVRFVARILGPKRGEMVLNWGLPLMVSGLIILWLSLQLFGYALIYYPWIDDPQAFARPEVDSHPFVSALYYSGVTLSTLGYGDIQPVSTFFRSIAIIEAISGAVTVSFSVAYVLAVYPALSHQRTIATAFDAEVVGQANALPMLRRYLNEHGEWSTQLSDQLRDLGLELLEVTQSHETHSVLYYAHPRRIQHSFLRLLVTAQSLVSLLRYTLSPDRYAGLVYHPHLLLLEQSLHYTLERLTTTQQLDADPERDAKQRAALVAEFDQLCADLEELDITSARQSAAKPVPVLVESDAESDPADVQDHSASPASTYRYDGKPEVMDPALDLESESPVEAFIAFRRETDAHIEAYAETCGYTLEAARGDYGTGWWLGDHLGRTG